MDDDLQKLFCLLLTPNFPYSLVAFKISNEGCRSDLPAFTRYLAAAVGHSLVDAVPCVDAYEHDRAVFSRHKVKGASASDFH